MANASVLNTFPDALVQTIDGTPFRAVDLDFNNIGPFYSPSTSPASYDATHRI